MSRFDALWTRIYSFAIALRRRWLDSFKKEWHKHALFLLLFLTLAMVVTTTISKLYQFWDVGSNSWLDRLKVEGWEFHRGAATVEHDQFAGQFSNGANLVQGPKPATTMWL